MRQNGVTKVDHYLDDFITMGPPNSEACSANLHQILALCEDLGAMDKLDGPTQCLTFLGIEIDTQAGILRLSADKLSRLKAQLTGRSVRKSCRCSSLRHSLVRYSVPAGWSGQEGRSLGARSIYYVFEGPHRDTTISSSESFFPVDPTSPRWTSQFASIVTKG